MLFSAQERNLRVQIPLYANLPEGVRCAGAGALPPERVTWLARIPEGVCVAAAALFFRISLAYPSLLHSRGFLPRCRPARSRRAVVGEADLDRRKENREL
jgi:hypothetical protein